MDIWNSRMRIQWLCFLFHELFKHLHPMRYIFQQVRFCKLYLHPLTRLIKNNQLQNRYMVIRKSFMIKTLNSQSFLANVSACTLLGFVWSILPALGWSYYDLEGGLNSTHCSVKWADPSWNVLSYNVTILIFVFLVPLTFITIVNYKLVLLVIQFLLYF
jgi:hypothetical protein